MLKLFSVFYFMSCFTFWSVASVPEEDFPREIPKLQSSYWYSVTAGGIRGGVYLLEHPLVAAMDRIALTGKSTTVILKKIIRDDGLKGLWRGGSTVIARMTSWPLRMVGYQWVGEHIQPGYFKTFSAVGVMSVIDTLFLKPFDTLRIAMVSATGKNPFKLRKTLSPRVLYKNVFTIGSSNFYTWSVYLHADTFFKNQCFYYFGEENLNPLQFVGVAGATTLTSGVLCAPVRLIMTNLQAPGATCHSFLKGWTDALQKIGTKGVMRHLRLGTVAYLPGNIAATFLFDWLDRKSSMVKTEY